MDAAKDIHKEILPIWAATAVIELLMMGGKTPRNILNCKQSLG
jgi:hypothetical protein